MTSTHICSLHDPVSQSLKIRQATTKFEIDQLRAALNDEHYLKAGRPAGNAIWQGVYQTDADEGYPVREPSFADKLLELVKGKTKLVTARNLLLAGGLKQPLG
jgi:hypothetical protein